MRSLKLYVGRREGMDVAKVMTRGQVTIPARIRRRAGIRAGDSVTLEVVGPGEVTLKVLPSMSLAEALERYRIEKPVNDREDRADWQDQAAGEVISDG
jgi:AbrB family looped-hinge helix DNA binding protein